MRCTGGSGPRLSSPQTPTSTALPSRTVSLLSIPTESGINPTELDTKPGMAGTAAAQPHPRQLTMSPSSVISLPNYAQQCRSTRGACTRSDTPTVGFLPTNSHANSLVSLSQSECKLAATSSQVANRQTQCRSFICTEQQTQTCLLTAEKAPDSPPRTSCLHAVPLMQWHSSTAAMSHLPRHSSQATLM